MQGELQVMDIPLPSIDLAHVVLHTDDRVNQADADASSSDAAAWKLLEQRIMPGAAAPACLQSAVQILQNPPAVSAATACNAWTACALDLATQDLKGTFAVWARPTDRHQSWQLSYLGVGDSKSWSMPAGGPAMIRTRQAPYCSCCHRHAACTCASPHSSGCFLPGHQC